MTAVINGESRTFRDGITLSELVAELDLAGRRIAVELNRELVPRYEFERRRVADGDHIEIVQFVGGG